MAIIGNETVKKLREKQRELMLKLDKDEDNQELQQELINVECEIKSFNDTLISEVSQKQSEQIAKVEEHSEGTEQTKKMRIKKLKEIYQEYIQGYRQACDIAKEYSKSKALLREVLEKLTKKD